MRTKLVVAVNGVDDQVNLLGMLMKVYPMTGRSSRPATLVIAILVYAEGPLDT